MNRSTSTTETVQDLELTLAPFLFKEGKLASDYLRLFPNIVFEEKDDDDGDDDDDNVQIYLPAHPAEDLEYNAFRLPSYSNAWEYETGEEDLELRLGVGGNSNCGTDGSETKFKDPNSWKSGKAHSNQCLHDYSEVKLRCSICLDRMKEETSTTCGHIFCHSCITNAIRLQQRCPTCRHKLTLSNIHRIYLPGESSS